MESISQYKHLGGLQLGPVFFVTRDWGGWVSPVSFGLRPEIFTIDGNECLH